MDGLKTRPTCHPNVVRRRAEFGLTCQIHPRFIVCLTSTFTAAQTHLLNWAANLACISAQSKHPFHNLTNRQTPQKSGLRGRNCTDAVWVLLKSKR